MKIVGSNPRSGIKKSAHKFEKPPIQFRHGMVKNMITKNQLEQLKETAAFIRVCRIQTGRHYYTHEPIFYDFSTHFFNAEKLEIGHIINKTATYSQGNTFYLGMTSLDPDSGFSPRKWSNIFWDDWKTYPLLKKELV